jgi:hypothetical protein
MAVARSAPTQMEMEDQQDLFVFCNDGRLFVFFFFNDLCGLSKRIQLQIE